MARVRRGDGAARARGRGLSGAPSGGELARELHIALQAAPARGASWTPRLTAQIWLASCRGAEHRRCGLCELCEWEREAQLWAAVSPWNEELRPHRSPDAARWRSLDAALLALAHWERDGRAVSSTTGAALERLARGECSGGERDISRAVPRVFERAGELVDVRRAVDAAAADCESAVPAETVVGAMMQRLTAPGESTSVEALAATLGVHAKALAAALRRMRGRIAEELASRGLISVRRHRRGGSSTAVCTTWRSTEAQSA